ncbi:MAG: hypothetical protein RL352_1082 [Actinomycetota bacterium]|nr:hypothetical protein [Acidimicrobiia bacterium]
MRSPGLFAGDEIRELLIEVAENLRPGRPRPAVIIVGGSLLALHGLRSGTQDVDSSITIDNEVRAAATLVAERHNLSTNWLNDHAVPWHPQTLRKEDCSVLIDHPRLLVLGAPLPAIFLMKLNRSQPQDVVDMITLWPLVASSFPTALAVTDAFYGAFPAEAVDEYLGLHVVDIVRRAGHILPLDY